MAIGWRTIKTLSTPNAMTALSSGESDLYALTKAASQTLGLIALARASKSGTAACREFCRFVTGASLWWYSPVALDSGSIVAVTTQD